MFDEFLKLLSRHATERWEEAIRGGGIEKRAERGGSVPRIPRAAKMASVLAGISQRRESTERLKNNATIIMSLVYDIDYYEYIFLIIWCILRNILGCLRNVTIGIAKIMSLVVKSGRSHVGVPSSWQSLTQTPNSSKTTNAAPCFTLFTLKILLIRSLSLFSTAV